MDNNQDSLTRAYSSFGTFQTTLDHFGAVGIPNLVDRHTLPPTLSGSSRYEVLGTLRFFGLVDDKGKPNVPLLQKLIDQDTRRETLASLLREHYQGLFDLPLATAGPGEVKKWFAENSGASTAARAQTFFLSAAKLAGIQLHTLVAQSARVVTGSVKRKRRKVAKTNPDGNTNGGVSADENDEPNPSAHGETRSIALREGAGTVAITVSVDLWELEGDDRDFVFTLMDALKKYDKGETPVLIGRGPAKSGAAES